MFDKYLETAEARKRIVDELLAHRDELIGKEIEIDNRYPKMSAKYRGKLQDIQLREDKIFLLIESEPGKIKSCLVGSKDEKFACDITKHIPKTRIHTIE